MKMFLLILACWVIVLVWTFVGIFVTIQSDVYLSKGKDLNNGNHLNYLPEKIIKLETEYKGGRGIHFRGESNKLFRCDQDKKTCETLSPPDKISGEPAFKETDSLYPKFAPPPGKIKQTVFNSSRGLMSHHNER